MVVSARARGTDGGPARPLLRLEPGRSQLGVIASGVGVSRTFAQEGYIADEEHEAVTTAKVRACDVAWDETVSALSREALYLSGGKPDKAPYALLLGTTKARNLQALGPAKATVAGAALISKIEAIGEPRPVALAQGLGARTEALAVAEKADAEAELKLAAHGIERVPG